MNKKGRSLCSFSPKGSPPQTVPNFATGHGRSSTIYTNPADARLCMKCGTKVENGRFKAARMISTNSSIKAATPAEFCKANIRGGRVVPRRGSTQRKGARPRSLILTSTSLRMINKSTQGKLPAGRVLAPFLENTSRSGCRTDCRNAALAWPGSLGCFPSPRSRPQED
jgi:hypothetical protein